MQVTKSERLIQAVFIVVMLTFLAMNLSLGFVSELAGWARWLFLGLLLYFGAVSILTQSHFKKMASLDYALIVMILSYTASVLLSPNSTKAGIYLLLFGIEMLAIIRCTRSLSISSWRVIVLALFFAITIGAVLALVGVVSAGDMEGRLSGKTNANSVGVSCMIGLLLGWPQIWLKTRWKWGVRCVTLIPLLVLYLSGSRSSLGGLLVGTAFSFWAMRRVKELVWVMMGLLVVSVLYFGLFASTERREMLKDDFQTRVLRGETNEERLSSRQANWDECLYYWRMRPAIGWGFSATDPSGERPIDGSGYHGLLSSVGVVGVIGFAVHLMALLGSELRHRRRRFGSAGIPDTDPQNARWLFATGAGLSSGMLVQGVGEPWMIGVGSVMTFAYLFSLGALLSSISWADILERLDFRHGGPLPAVPPLLYGRQPTSGKRV